MISVVALATILAIVLVFALSLRLRQREIQTIFKLGCRRATIARLLTAEIFIIVIMSGVFCGALIFLVNQFSNDLVQDAVYQVGEWSTGVMEYWSIGKGLASSMRMKSFISVSKRLALFLLFSRDNCQLTPFFNRNKWQVRETYHLRGELSLEILGRADCWRARTCCLSCSS